jgi:hypothetical protein
MPPKWIREKVARQSGELEENDYKVMAVMISPLKLLVARTPNKDITLTKSSLYTMEAHSSVAAHSSRTTWFLQLPTV